MNLTLPLTPAEEAILLAKARSEGTTPERLVLQAIEPFLTAMPEQRVRSARRPDWDAELEKMIDTLPKMPILPDTALTREGIYAEDDDR